VRGKGFFLGGGILINSDEDGGGGWGGRWGEVVGVGGSWGWGVRCHFHGYPYILLHLKSSLHITTGNTTTKCTTGQIYTKQYQQHLVTVHNSRFFKQVVGASVKFLSQKHCISFFISRYDSSLEDWKCHLYEAQRRYPQSAWCHAKKSNSEPWYIDIPHNLYVCKK
jgi:hypothetical protein